jgi:hypothetical protein
MRISVPCLEAVCRLLTSEDAATREYCRWAGLTFLQGRTSPAEVANNLLFGFRGKFFFDRASLQEALGSAGFHSVRTETPGRSSHPALCNMERHGDVIPPSANEFESLIMEATK